MIDHIQSYNWNNYRPSVRPKVQPKNRPRPRVNVPRPRVPLTPNRPRLAPKTPRRVNPPTTPPRRVISNSRRGNNNTTTKAIQNQLRSERVNREDYSRIEGGDVIVSASMADEPVWSHEFTHRGIDLVKAKATQDPEDFIKKYGKDTFKFLTGTGEYDFTIRNDEFYTESFDDTEARQDATALKVKDKKGRSGIARTMGSDRNGMRSKLKEYIKDDMPVGEGWWGTVLGVEMGLNQAAEDILKEQGEPEKYVKPETSIWDDIKSSFN